MALQSITGGGVFTAGNIAALNSNFSALSGVDYWVRPQAGVSNADGTYDKPYASLAALGSKIVTGVTIGLEGVLFEEYTSVKGVNDVTIVGAYATPRQATTGGVANGGGATWLSPSGGTGALLKVQGQGWTVANLYFNNSATANPCIYLLTDGAGDPPTDADAAHFLAYNCILTGADDGVFVSGGTNWIAFERCFFFGFSGAGDCAVNYTAGAGVGTLTGWRFESCRFTGNATNIALPLSKARILNCDIDSGSAVTINLTGGTASNHVVGNRFNIAAADFDPAGGVTGVTGDVWSNTLTDTIETGLPAN